MQITRMTDFIYAYRLLDIIQKSWTEQDAYKYGIIDAKGNALRKYNDLRNSEEQNSFTYFHRIAFNIKRLLDKVPGMDNSKTMRLAAALRLLRENAGGISFSEQEIQLITNPIVKEEEPTNVTGSAIALPVDKPLNKKSSQVRRNP